MLLSLLLLLVLSLVVRVRMQGWTRDVVGVRLLVVLLLRRRMRRRRERDVHVRGLRGGVGV